MCHLQKLHEKYKDKDVVILGFNFSDNKKIAMDFLKDNSATFPNILDVTKTAVKTGFDAYKTQGVPLNYIIDRQGKIVDAWYGYEEGHKRAMEALQKAGAKVENE